MGDGCHDVLGGLARVRVRGGERCAAQRLDTAGLLGNMRYIGSNCSKRSPEAVLPIMLINQCRLAWCLLRRGVERSGDGRDCGQDSPGTAPPPSAPAPLSGRGGAGSGLTAVGGEHLGGEARTASSSGCLVNELAHPSSELPGVAVRETPSSCNQSGLE